MRGPAVDDTESKACELLGGPDYNVDLVSEMILEEVSLLLDYRQVDSLMIVTYYLSIPEVRNYHYCLMCLPYLPLLWYSCIECYLIL